MIASPGNILLTLKERTKEQMQATSVTHIFNTSDGQAIVTRWANTESQAQAIALEFRRDPAVLSVVVLFQPGSVLGDWKVAARRQGNTDDLVQSLKANDPNHNEWETGVPCSYLHVGDLIRRFQEAKERLQNFKANNALL